MMTTMMMGNSMNNRWNKNPIITISPTIKIKRTRNPDRPKNVFILIYTLQ